MRFWFARGGEISIREQLYTQVVLAIVSGELAPAHRLPSTRELARRFQLHANTISAGYRQLEREGWVEFRRGSGVYVRGAKPEKQTPQTLVLDALIADLFRSAREIGAPLSEVRARLRRWLSMQPPDHFLVVEPDIDLRSILVAEISRAVPMPVHGCAVEEFTADLLAGAIPVSLPSKKELLRKALPEGVDYLILKASSVPASLSGYLPAIPDRLVGIASRWSEFLKAAKTMLVASGFNPDSLVLRDAKAPGWKRGLKATIAVVCDCLTATELDGTCRTISFPIVAEDSLAELRSYSEQLTEPIT